MRRLLTSIAVSLVFVSPASGTPVDPLLVDECAFPAAWSPPFVHVYRLRNGGTLVFVGVRHGDDAPTHASIRSAFDRYKPNLVLVEGVSADKSPDPDYLKFVIDDADQRVQAGHPDEVAYTIKLAADAGVALSGWDRTPAQEYSASIANGFALDDVLGAHLIRRRANPLDGASEAAIRSELRYAAGIKRLDAFDYVAWYHRTYGDQFVQANGTPCGQGIASRIVKFETAERNRHLIDLIGSRVGKGKTVLIEAGANHWLALSDWLRSISTRMT